MIKRPQKKSWNFTRFLEGGSPEQSDHLITTCLTIESAVGRLASGLPVTGEARYPLSALQAIPPNNTLRPLAVQLVSRQMLLTQYFPRVSNLQNIDIARKVRADPALATPIPVTVEGIDILSGRVETGADEDLVEKYVVATLSEDIADNLLENKRQILSIVSQDVGVDPRVVHDREMDVTFGFIPAGCSTKQVQEALDKVSPQILPFTGVFSPVHMYDRTPSWRPRS